MGSTVGHPALVRWTLRLEDWRALDRPVRAVEPTIAAVFGSGRRGAVLRGDWLGHPLHPLLADVALGAWASASVLDLTGGPASAPDAQRLVGTGLLLVGPTAWAGWAQWSEAGQCDKRVGLVHAVTNGVTIVTYLASYAARRTGRHDAGARLALGGATLAVVAGYLGGHLAGARKVGTHDPAYGAGPLQ